MQMDPPATKVEHDSPPTAFQVPPIHRPSSAVPIRPFAPPPIETAAGLASTIPYIPIASQMSKKEFAYVQKRLRKTSMDVTTMV